jgi:hypothetical protein
MAVPALRLPEMASTTPSVQPRIGLPVNPADARLADALRAAGRYWMATPAHWVLPVVAVALVNLLAVVVLGGAFITAEQMQALMVAGPMGPQLDMEGLPRVVAGPVAVGIVTIVARWFLVANAIAGLRRREITMAWVIGAGIRSFAADMLVALTLVMLVSVAAMLGPIALLGLPVAVPLGLYVALRLTFWTLAIFDGQPVFGGAAVSWRVSRRAVLRVFGWSLAIAGIGFLAGIPLTILELVTPSAPVVSAVVGGTVETMLAAWTLVVMAVLYESQRLRTDPVAYQASLGLAAARPVVEEPRGPYDPPPPPPPG